MPSRDVTDHHPDDHGSVESWLVSAGRDRRPGSPLNVPPIPASNVVLGERRAYSRDDGTPGWEALEEIVGGLEGGSSIAFASGMAGIAAIFDQLTAGSVIATPDDCYQGVAGLAQAGQRRGRWTVNRFSAWTVGVPLLAAGMFFESAVLVAAGAWALFVGVSLGTLDSACVVLQAFRTAAATSRDAA